MGLSPRVRGNPWQGPFASGSSRVYPRVYGGTSVQEATPGFPRGLSPRVRGNLSRDGAAPRSTWSIPACTGEPTCRPRASAGAEVYPRVYGGTGAASGGRAGRYGLSPRVRGNRGTSPAEARQRRSIPACTGEPPSWAWTTPRWTVYPRVYGGTAPMAIGAVEGARSIPACTGEPYAAVVTEEGKRVYPRVYGGTTTPELSPGPG